MTCWALQLTRDDAGSLDRLRLERGLEVLEQAALVWVRGPKPSDDLRRRLEHLPAVNRFDVDQGRLIPAGARLSVGALPRGAWRPLFEWLQLDTGPAALPAEPPPPLALRVVPGGYAPQREPSLLLTSRRPWRDWASSASELRLRPLSVATDSSGRVLVRGHPLPPLPGQRWLESEGVAVPCGHGWSPGIDPATCAVVLGLLPGDLALLHPAGDWERLDADRFGPATRAQARALGEDPRA